MTIWWPWSLLGLVAVAAAAAWALLRPGRQLAIVSTLSLWEQAAAALDRSARRRSKRMTASWVLLLLGAVLAVLAGARPIHEPTSPARRLAIALYPSAELAGDAGLADLRQTADGLISRLGPSDRVQILLPSVLGARAEWLSPSQARDRVAEVRVLPVAAEELTVPAPDEESQHLYRIVPAVIGGAAGPDVSVIKVSSRPAAVTIDAFGAVELDKGKTMQLFVAVRNQQASSWRGRVVLAVPALDGRPGRTILDQAVDLPAGQRRAFTRDAPTAEAIRAAVLSPQGPLPGAGTAAFLARRSAAVRKVAMTGVDEPLLRRYIRVDPLLELVADARRADIVVANRAPPPVGRPALVIDPPSPPAGWSRGRAIESLNLTQADLATDQPVMRDVRLAGVQVRRVQSWVRSELAEETILASCKGEAIILCRQSSGRDTAPVPRQVYVAFALDTENTNFAMRDDFVIFLANVMRFLSPPGGQETAFVSASPLAAGLRQLRELSPVDVPAGDPFGGDRCPLPAPGLYRDSAGQLQAVSLAGLRSAPAAEPPVETAAAATLPAPAPTSERKELWPILLALAGAAWLVGWGLRGSG